MKVRVDFFPITDASVMTYVTVQFDNKDLQLKNKDGVSTANIHVFGEFTTISRRIVGSFEEDMQIDGGPSSISPIGRSASPSARRPCLCGPARTAWWWSARTGRRKCKQLGTDGHRAAPRSRYPFHQSRFWPT